MSAIRLALAAAALAATVAQAAETAVRDVATRPGVTQRYLLVKPELPAASVILFAGGAGGLNIGGDGSIGRQRSNFLVRTRESFARNGLMVAVIDAPSDHLPNGLNRFRLDPGHVADIAAVIAALRKEAAVPVWLIGTSRGTTSAAHAAATLKSGGPDGIVLTASMVSPRDWGYVGGFDLESIAIPVLMVHHEADECRHTLARDVPAVMARFKSAARSELAVFSGGGPPRGDACQAQHYHGFVGIEEDVVRRIGDWIKAGTPPGPREPR